MSRWITDEIDFAAYEAETEFKARVRKPAAFEDELAAEFAPKDRSGRKPRMSSAKLGRLLDFREAEVTVWAGYNGHRKSMFTGQVALDLIEQGERTLMVSLEMLPRKTLYRMCRQATAHDQPSSERRGEFLRWTDDRLWLFDHVGRLNPKRCLALCRYFADELKGRHVFIDSMMKVCESEESLDEQKQLVGDLCNLGQETGLHLHLIAHCKKPGADGESRPPTKYDIRGSSAISDQSANIVTVWMNKAKRAETEKPVELQNRDITSKPMHIVTVEKQRNDGFEGRLSMEFDNRSMRFIDDEDSRVDPYPMEFA